MNFVTKEEILDGFSPSQIEELMRNMTIFMTMDWCPSPCDICLYRANKKKGLSMDFSAIEYFFSAFADDFNRNDPSEFASDKLAYHGRNGETIVDVLGLHKKYHDHFPVVYTAFPKGAGELIWQILNMDSGEREAVVPTISRHPRNEGVIDAFLERVERDDRFIGKERAERGPKGYDDLYEVETGFGARKLRVKKRIIILAGDGAKYKYLNEWEGKLMLYYIPIHPGVAVTPTGFYRFGYNVEVPDVFNNKITPDNFFINKRWDVFPFVRHDLDTGDITKTVYGVKNHP